MEYQELELGIAKKLTEKTRRHFSYQLVVNGCLLLWLVCCSAGVLYSYEQMQALHWHLNATHARVRELERWQRHMCAVRHYNCPEGLETPEYTDDWDWENFPSMDDYTYEDPGMESAASALPHGERKKREIIAETTDGVPIYTQPYAHAYAQHLNETKRRNKMAAVGTARRGTPVPIIQAGYHSPAWPVSGGKHNPELKLYEELENNQMSVTSRPIVTRASRVMVTPDVEESEEEHAPRAKSLPRTKALDTQPDHINYAPSSNARSYRRRNQRQRVVESFEDDVAGAPVAAILKPTRRHIPAAHYHGDTSKYAIGIHQNYHGNGHLKHMDRTYVDWISSDWMSETNQDGVFELNNGVLTINEDGLYFVYSQIFYVDDHDLNGYHIYRNQEMILQCTTMTHSTSRVRKSNTCYTAGVEKLAAGDRVYVRDLSNERFSLFEKGKSFFGALKLSDMRVK